MEAGGVVLQRSVERIRKLRILHCAHNASRRHVSWYTQPIKTAAEPWGTNGAEMRVSGKNNRSYFPRRLSPNVDGLSSPKDFPSTSALCVMHTSLTITPCTQEARNFAGFEQSRTSQTPSLTGSKYNSGLDVIACSPLLLVATRPGYFNESRIPSCDYFAFGFFPRPDLLSAQRSTAFLLPWSWSCFSTPFASMRLCIGATDRSDLDSPGVPARAAFGKGDRKCSGSLRFCNSR